MKKSQTNKRNFHNILGRVGGLAVIDIVGTILVSFGVAKLLNLDVPLTIIFGFILGEVIHLLVGVGSVIYRVKV